MGIDLNIKARLEGRFRLQTKDAKTGRLTQDTGWFKNLITDSGLDQIGNLSGVSGQSYYPTVATDAFVGTGNTAPANTDTQMTSYLASVGGGTGKHPYATSYVAGPPAYWSAVASWDFPEGSATGNIAEVGAGSIFDSSTNPPTYTLFSHALVVDSNGNPTTITVLSTEVLTLSYELRCYIDTTDNTGTASISGTSYNITWRAQSINIPPPIVNSLSNNQYGWRRLHCSDATALGSITSTPTGGRSSRTYASLSSYISGSYQMSATWAMGINEINFANGISTMWFECSVLKVQILFNNPIPKSSNYKMTITATVSWARYP